MGVFFHYGAIKGWHLVYGNRSARDGAKRIRSSAQDRRLTPKEAMRLQGFKDTFVRDCSDSQQYKQAGNSISVTVIKAVIKNLLGI